MRAAESKQVENKYSLQVIIKMKTIFWTVYYKCLGFVGV